MGTQGPAAPLQHIMGACHLLRHAFRLAPCVSTGAMRFDCHLLRHAFRLAHRAARTLDGAPPGRCPLAG